MATKTDMINRIAAELGSRFDLAGGAAFSGSTPNSNAIRNAIDTAIAEYQKERFRFNEIDPSVPTTFTTNPNQTVYTVADSPVISSMYHVDYLNIAISNTLLELERSTPERLHLANQLFNQAGQPTSWAYEGNAIILYPSPVANYTIYVGAHLFLAGPADDVTSNVWLTTAENLIRCRAKWEIATHVTRNKDMQMAMSPDINGGPGGTPGATYRAWRSLKSEANKITGTGRIRPMQF